jgi:hypothetical protein
MLFEHLSDIRPLTLRITHADLSGETALDFMVEGLTESPLPHNDAVQAIRSQVKSIIEESTTRGFRIKIILK